MISRRDFLLGSASLLAASAISPKAFADTVAPEQSLRIKLGVKGRGIRVPENFTGLSYESRALGDPDFFSENNKELIEYVRGLGKRGVLRIGGNSSEFADWEPYILSAGAPPKLPSALKKLPVSTLINAKAIRNLRGFLEAADWDLIYGVNLGTGTADEAADEAAAVYEELPKRLIGIQIGNEPDLYHSNGLRPPRWKYEDYHDEWRVNEQAIMQKTPNIAFGGPDAASNIQWFEQFSRSGAPNLAFLSNHYYAGGPPSNPDMNIASLLQNDKRILSLLDASEEAAKAANLPYRITETNSCYGGGKLGVSDTFASALWAADHMLRLASRGVAGVNFHSGGNSAYTPIHGSLKEGFSARPVYYGMLLAGQFAGAEFLETQYSGPDSGAYPNLSVYAAELRGQIRIALINRDLDRPVQAIIETGSSENLASVWRLSAPAVDSADGVALAGAAVNSNGAWKPSNAEISFLDHGALTLNVPAASALIAFV